LSTQRVKRSHLCTELKTRRKINDLYFLWIASVLCHSFKEHFLSATYVLMMKVNVVVKMNLEPILSLTGFLKCRLEDVTCHARHAGNL
jgi:hypothetical protein